MMYEIGSEFWTETDDEGNGINSYLPQSFHIRETLCGRTALDLIIEDISAQRPVRSVYMPSFCCHTMIEPFLKHGILVQFYNVFAVQDGFRADYHSNSCDMVFLIDYFGFLCKETLQFAAEEQARGKITIYDATHAFFCIRNSECYFNYVFGSMKKWLGVNAGFAAKQSAWCFFPRLEQHEAFIHLRMRAFDLKAKYFKVPDEEAKKKFLKLFYDAEALLEHDYKYYAPDERSVKKLEKLNVEALRNCRIRNAKVLIAGLQGVKGLSLPCAQVQEGECPLFVPICVEQGRDALRRHLIEERIYLPVHWPKSELHSLNSRSIRLYETELSCVCDQRYNEQDMERIVREIRSFSQKK